MRSFYMMLISINLPYKRTVRTMGLKGGIDMQLGERLQKIRSDNNLTQEELAAMLHVTRQTVSNWEHEKSYPDLESLIKISEHFDISVDMMLKEDSKMTTEIDKNIKWANRLKMIPFIMGLCVWEFLVFEIFVDISLGLLIGAIVLAIASFVCAIMILKIERTTLTIVSAILCFIGMTVILFIFAIMFIMGMGE